MLKRTGFKRQTVERRPLPAPQPVRRVAPTVISDKANATPKAEIVRSEQYRRLVAAMPCVICGIAGYSQAAHGSEGKGMAIKACDLTLFPACCDRPGVRGCHSQLDQGALFAKTVRRALEPAWAADTQRKIIAAGQWPKGLPIPNDFATQQEWANLAIKTGVSNG